MSPFKFAKKKHPQRSPPPAPSTIAAGVPEWPRPIAPQPPDTAPAAHRSAPNVCGWPSRLPAHEHPPFETWQKQKWHPPFGADERLRVFTEVLATPMTKLLKSVREPSENLSSITRWSHWVKRWDSRKKLAIPNCFQTFLGVFFVTNTNRTEATNTGGWEILGDNAQRQELTQTEFLQVTWGSLTDSQVIGTPHDLLICFVKMSRKFRWIRQIWHPQLVPNSGGQASSCEFEAGGDLLIGCFYFIDTLVLNLNPCLLPDISSGIGLTLKNLLWQSLNYHVIVGPKPVPTKSYREICVAINSGYYMFISFYIQMHRK